MKNKNLSKVLLALFLRKYSCCSVMVPSSGMLIDKHSSKKYDFLALLAKSFRETLPPVFKYCEKQESYYSADIYIQAYNDDTDTGLIFCENMVFKKIIEQKSFDNTPFAVKLFFNEGVNVRNGLYRRMKVFDSEEKLMLEFFDETSLKISFDHFEIFGNRFELIINSEVFLNMLLFMAEDICVSFKFIKHNEALHQKYVVFYEKNHFFDFYDKILGANSSFVVSNQRIYQISNESFFNMVEKIREEVKNIKESRILILDSEHPEQFDIQTKLDGAREKPSAFCVKVDLESE